MKILNYNTRRYFLVVITFSAFVSLFVWSGQSNFNAVEAQAVRTQKQAVTDSPSATASGTFTNPAAITIPADATVVATPYSSNITVAGQTGVISNVTVSLNNFSHTFAADVSVLLVGPTGQKVLLLAQGGGGTASTGANVVFDDAAAQHISQTTAIVSGTFNPSNFAGSDGSDVVFPAPAPQATPASPYRATLQAFNQTNANGVWSLYVVDNFDGDGGSIAGGWTLNITTTATPQSRSNQFIIFEGSLTATDAAQTGRLLRGGVISETDGVTPCPGPSGTAALVYDTYSITNQNTVAVPVSVTTTSACGVNVFGSAYTPNYSAANGVCTNYLADGGLSPTATSGIGTTFSFSMNPGQTVQLVANNVTTGTYCADYSLLVEGKIVNPTAAGAQIGGQVVSPTGKAVSNALVTISDMQGKARQIRTNAFGKFNFANLEAGSTYVIGVTSKQYLFNPQAVNLTDNISDLTITAAQ